ncbi:MAG: hypothetical protein KF764_13595 [Labilithrix sp.]|nr:hypothetical protein [Labilithrix sp.]
MEESAKLGVLKSLRFGQQVAEDEGADLVTYFVETGDWQRLFAGEVDVIYGQKGAGKSALYSLLLKREAELRGRNISVVAAENVRGATAFQELTSDPPPTEYEFAGLWKTYILCLVGDLLHKEGFDDEDARVVVKALKDNDLMMGDRSLAALVRAAAEYVKRLLRVRSVEGGVSWDPLSSMPTGFTGKIVMGEPTTEEAARGVVGVGTLFAAASRSLAKNGRAVWILIDRLDVAFAESPQLEENALRALFKTYLDLLGNTDIRLKIFLRSDIWRRITATGFREASHITRQLTIEWDRPSILDLIVRRALRNQPLVDFYSVTQGSVLASVADRLALFNRICHERADPGTNKPKTLDWIISRTRDGSQVTAPREVVHLLNETVAVQVRKLDLGEDEPEGELLFSRAAFKEALPKVSKVRLEQTLYAEYPSLKPSIEALREEKSLQSPATLAQIWTMDETEAMKTATVLAEIGFFERRGSKHEPQFWIPFLYRGHLGIVQGTADEGEL